MDIKSLQQLSNEIRSSSKSQRRVRWPVNFKSEVIKLRSQGTSGRELSKATGISYSTIMHWTPCRELKNKKSNFKAVHIQPSITPDILTLTLPTGSEVRGLIFSDLCKLLKEGLI